MSDREPANALATVAGVGDINSQERGSGARYNGGKPDFSLIPLTLIAKAWQSIRPNSVYAKALWELGMFQETHRTSWLYEMVHTLGEDGWEECAHVFDYGKRKYAAWNWAKGMPWSVPLASCARHLFKMLVYEEMVDDESGLPHRGHIFCNVVMLLTYSASYVEGNDLPPKGTLR